MLCELLDHVDEEGLELDLAVFAELHRFVEVGLLALVSGDYFIDDEELQPHEVYAVFKHVLSQFAREDGQLLLVVLTFYNFVDFEDEFDEFLGHLVDD